MRVRLLIGFLLGAAIAPIAFADNSSLGQLPLPTLPTLPIPTTNTTPPTHPTPPPTAQPPSPAQPPAPPNVSVSFSANRRVYMPGHTFVVSMFVRNISPATLSTVACLAVPLRAGTGMKLVARGSPFLRVGADPGTRTYTPCWAVDRLHAGATRTVLLVIGTLPRGRGPIRMYFVGHGARIATAASFQIEQHR